MARLRSATAAAALHAGPRDAAAGPDLGLWHLPVSPLAVLVTRPIAFLYTWLYNRTHSVVRCMLLHAGVTPAQEHLLLITDQAFVALVQIGTLIAATVAVVVATRGGLADTPDAL